MKNSASARSIRNPRRAHLASGLLLASLALLCTSATAQSGAPEATAAKVSPAPVAPATPVLSLSSVKLLPRAGEILLEGRIFGVDAGSRSFILEVSSFTLPSGKKQSLANPKVKKIVLSEAGIEGGAIRAPGDGRKLTLTELKPGLAATAIGRDLGSGRELPARLVNLAIESAGVTPGATPALAAVSVPVPAAASVGAAPVMAPVAGIAPASVPQVPVTGQVSLPGVVLPAISVPGSVVPVTPSPVGAVKIEAPEPVAAVPPPATVPVSPAANNLPALAVPVLIATAFTAPAPVTLPGTATLNIPAPVALPGVVTAKEIATTAVALPNAPAAGIAVPLASTLPGIAAVPALTPLSATEAQTKTGAAGTDVRMKYLLAQSYAELKDERAPALFEEVLTKIADWGEAPPAAEVLDALAKSYAALGQPVKAAEALERMPQYTKVPMWLSNSLVEAARFYLEVGNEDRAKELYARVGEKGYGWGTGMAIYDLATFLMAKGEHREARRMLQQPVAGAYADQIRVLLNSELAFSWYCTGDADTALKATRDTLEGYKLLQNPLRNEGLEGAIAKANLVQSWLERWKNAGGNVICEPNAIPVYLYGKETGNEPFVYQFSVHSRRPAKSIIVSDNSRVLVRPLEKLQGLSTGYSYQNTYEIKIQKEDLPYVQGTTLIVRPIAPPGSEIRVPLDVRSVSLGD